MRVLAVAAAAVIIAAGAATVEGSASATTTTASPTVKVVVRPVTSTGHLAAGYTLATEPTGSVDCSFADPSPGAVSRNVEFCSPSAEYAVACWKSAVAHRVLCIRNPRHKQVVRIPRTGAFAPTALAPALDRAPLGMTLGNGAYCSIRDGGAWSSLHSHPTWSGTYSCTNGSVVWAPPTSHHWGINEIDPSWTVRTAPASGVGSVVIRHVVKAWFVGTASA
jgi:hypothetical protein